MMECFFAYFFVAFEFQSETNSLLDEQSSSDYSSQDNDCFKFSTKGLKKPKRKKAHDAEHSSEK